MNKIQRCKLITRSAFVSMIHLDSVKVSSADIGPLIYHLVFVVDQTAQIRPQEKVLIKVIVRANSL